MADAGGAESPLGVFQAGEWGFNPHFFGAGQTGGSGEKKEVKPPRVCGGWKRGRGSFELLLLAWKSQNLLPDGPCVCPWQGTTC